jgi:predicted transcriptional regulator
MNIMKIIVRKNDISVEAPEAFLQSVLNSSWVEMLSVAIDPATSEYFRVHQNGSHLYICIAKNEHPNILANLHQMAEQQGLGVQVEQG